MAAYDEFTTPYVSSLAPVGKTETELARACADLQFRLHRLSAAEHNLFALGHEEHGRPASVQRKRLSASGDEDPGSIAGSLSSTGIRATPARLQYGRTRRIPAHKRASGQKRIIAPRASIIVAGKPTTTMPWVSACDRGRVRLPCRLRMLA